MPRVIATDRLNKHYVAFEIEAPEIAAQMEPGQLLEVRRGEQAPHLPHAIADFDRDKGTVSVVTRITGESDTATDPANMSIEVGSLFGRHRALKGISKILCVGEGLGVAGLYTRLQEFKANDTYTIVVVGFESKDFVYWIDRLDSLSDELYVVTEDGSYGIKGPVRHTVKAVCAHDLDIDCALAIGSVQLLKTCCRITSNHSIPTMISLNAALLEGADEAQPRIWTATRWISKS
jgi:ferredoxin--NADP+ reductase